MTQEQLMNLRNRSKKEYKQIIDDMLLFKNELEKNLERREFLIKENRILNNQIEVMIKCLDIIHDLTRH